MSLKSRLLRKSPQMKLSMCQTCQSCSTHCVSYSDTAFHWWKPRMRRSLLPSSKNTKRYVRESLPQFHLSQRVVSRRLKISRQPSRIRCYMGLKIVPCKDYLKGETATWGVLPNLMWLRLWLASLLKATSQRTQLWLSLKLSLIVLFILRMHKSSQIWESWKTWSAS